MPCRYAGSEVVVFRERTLQYSPRGRVAESKPRKIIDDGVGMGSKDARDLRNWVDSERG